MPPRKPATHHPVIRDAGKQIFGMTPTLTCNHCATSQKPSEDAVCHYLGSQWPQCCGEQMILTIEPPAKKKTKPKTPKE